MHTSASWYSGRSLPQVSWNIATALHLWWRARSPPRAVWYGALTAVVTGFLSTVLIASTC